MFPFFVYYFLYDYAFFSLTVCIAYFLYLAILISKFSAHLGNTWVSMMFGFCIHYSFQNITFLKNTMSSLVSAKLLCFVFMLLFNVSDT